MKTKKIVAESMPLALKMVRQQLGDNAIIVNTRAIKTGGFFGFFSRQKYEVTAYSMDKNGPSSEPKFAVEFKQKLENNAEQVQPLKADNQVKGSSGFHKNPQNLYNYYSQPMEGKEATLPPLKVTKGQPTSPQQAVSSDSEVLNELKNMRKMMASLMMNQPERNVLPASVIKVVDRLKKQGVHEEVIDYLVNRLMDQFNELANVSEELIEIEVVSLIEAIITQRLPQTTAIDEKTRMINVIGPTGVGKTTSIAKLATEQVLKQKRRVAMITTDVYRIGAVEQLKTYAGILNVPIEIVRTAEELNLAVQKLNAFDLIYMDTTGRNYKEDKYRDSVFEFLAHPLKSENYLVLSMTTKYEDMEVLLEEFMGSPIQKLILTKFDETSSYGSILNIAYKFPYELVYITNGQSVPEDITTLDPAALSRSIIGKG